MQEQGIWIAWNLQPCAPPGQDNQITSTKIEMRPAAVNGQKWQTQNVAVEIGRTTYILRPQSNNGKFEFHIVFSS
jgi:hypothetical protein